MLTPRLRALTRRAIASLQTHLSQVSGNALIGAEAAAVRHDHADVLVFGVVVPGAGAPAADDDLHAVFDRLVSFKFQIDVAEPTLDRTLGTGLDQPPEAIRSWARNVFGALAPYGASRLDLLAAVLETEPLAAMLMASTAIPWSVNALALALRAARVDNGSPIASALPRDLSLARWAHLAKGINVAKTQGVEPDGPEAEQAHTCTVEFSLDLQVAAASAFCQIDFGAITPSGDEAGSLWLDYGEGYKRGRRLLLTPMGRVRYAAVIATTGLQRLKWEPASSGEAVLPILLTARPASWDQIEQRTRTTGGEEGLDLLNSIFGDNYEDHRAFRVSRQLTRVLGGHRSFERTYMDWIQQHEPQGQEAQRLWQSQIAQLSDKPLISVLVPVYETPENLLREMIESVRAQIYPHWELCIADDGSTSPHVRELLEEYAVSDPRIKVVFRLENGHISAASNTALEQVEGEWTALLDHDDVLTPNALLALALEIVSYPEAQLIYSDEDKLDINGIRSDPFFKPEYSPELLLAQNYLNHLTAHRTTNIRAAGGWRVGFEGSQDYDLNLRVLERIDPKTVRHIPHVLYHWRMTEGSTALASNEKGYAAQAGLAAIADHLSRKAPRSQVELLTSGYYRVRHAIPDPPPLVSLIIPTRDMAELLAQCVDSITERSTYPNYEILIIDNGSVEEETKQLFERLAHDERVRILPFDAPFNYSAINNYAVSQARGNIVGLINNDIEVITSDWLEEMVSWATHEGIGCVGAKLYYGNGIIQHAGVVLGIGGVAGHSHKYYPRESSGYFSRLLVHHNVSAVTAACLLVRRAVFEAVGGLDERLTVAFNDVDLCIKVQSHGYRNIFTPHAEFFHYESASRGQEDTAEKKARFKGEVDLMLGRWPNELKSDRYYSPNLSLINENYEFRWLDD